MYDNLIIKADSSIINALKQMDSKKRKLLMVFLDSEFIGLLSIGDIQRAIINNIDLNTPIEEILRKDIILARHNESIESIKKKMFQIRAEFMPVLDNKKKLVKVIYWEDLFENFPLPPRNQFKLPVVIMAGGFGTRLRPLTNVIPKPLIPIRNKTIIEHIFDRFHYHGCNHFFISVNYKAKLIEYYLSEQNLPYKLLYFKEDKPMGTAGSLSLLKGKINDTFFVTNCDILIEQDYSEILDYHRHNKNEITVIAAMKSYNIPYGTIQSGKKGELIDLIEKPNLTFKINSGMYILEPHLIDEIPNNEFFHITHLIEKVKNRNGRVGVFPVSEKSWKDIGEWDIYLKELTI